MSTIVTQASNSQTASSPLVFEPVDAATRLQSSTEQWGHGVVVHASGEVDAYTLTTWQRLLREAAATATAPGYLVINLEPLGFIGCRAFAVLADQAQRCRRRGIQLRLVSTASIVTRIIAAADLTELLPVYTSIDTGVDGKNARHWTGPGT
ncbi:anti-sigma factor antagonist [Nocardia sp. CA-129566]|uniref:anti-sigma factor antagonist n=1 Tax=Nocardia sp. CA-129566 TaxID=3239976 RepID=UPI003D986FC4